MDVEVAMARQYEDEVYEKGSTIMFRIRQQYFWPIVRGEKREEIRRASPYWLSFLERKPSPAEALFVCGHNSHRRKIMGIDLVKEGGAFVLGRPLSEQGKLDIGDGPVVVFRLGPEVAHGRST